jgi:hypothetical protein
VLYLHLFIIHHCILRGLNILVSFKWKRSLHLSQIGLESFENGRGGDLSISELIGLCLIFLTTLILIKDDDRNDSVTSTVSYLGVQLLVETRRFHQGRGSLRDGSGVGVVDEGINKYTSGRFELDDGVQLLTGLVKWSNQRYLVALLHHLSQSHITN